MSRLLAIARRETSAFFHSAMAPVVVTSFLILVGLFFTIIVNSYSETSLASLRSGAPDPSLNLAEGVLQPLVGYVSVFLLLLLPAVTMRLFSGEFRSGRYDLLMSYPVEDRTWVLGKFLAVLAVCGVLLVSTVVHFGVAAILGHPDVGPMASSLIGLLLLAAVIAAWGLYFSSLVAYQVVSYLLTFGFLLVLYTIGSLEYFVPDAIGRFLRSLALLDHFHRFSRGVVDTRDVAYYLSLTIVGLAAATASLGGRRLPPGRRFAGWVPVLVLALLLGTLNVIVVRHPHTWDWTRGQRYNLAPQTVHILRDLDEDIRITSFNQNLDPYRRNLETFLHACGDQSDRVIIDMVDIERDLAAVEDYGVDRARTVFVEAGERRMRLIAPQETAVINAIFRLQTGARPVVYTVLGHGERRIDNEDRGGYSAMAAALGEEGYLVRELFMAGRSEVPSDADVLVLAAPKLEIGDVELAALTDFIAGGGALLALLDPQTPPSVDTWMRRYNVALGRDFIAANYESGREAGLGPRTVLVNEGYGRHPICEGMRGLYTLFPLTQSMAPAGPAVDGIASTVILSSSYNTWSETDAAVMASGRPTFDQDVDRAGPIVLGVALEVGGGATAATEDDAPVAEARPTVDDPLVKRLEANRRSAAAAPPSIFSRSGTGRIVVIGDSDFAANANLQLYGNLNFMLNVFGWLEAEENLVGRRGRHTPGDPVVLTDAQKDLIGWGAILGWPVAAGVVCTGMLLRRRRGGRVRRHDR